MAFTDHKISAFAHKISDLADQPNLPPDELKARFDSSPEELRVAHNAACDEAARLDERVDGIITGTFGGTITENMLSSELITELDAKATQAALTAAVSTLEAADAAEATAREEADDALDTRIDELTASLGECTRIETGYYAGNGSSSRSISLSFAPKAAIIAPQGGQYMCMVLQGMGAYNGSDDLCYLSGRTLSIDNVILNRSNCQHFWITFA